VLTGYLSLGCWPDSDIAQKFCNLLSQQQVAAAPVTSKLSALSHSSTRFLLQIQQLYYALIMQYIFIMCIDNNAIINNNYGRLQDLILLFKIPTRARKKKSSKFIEHLGTRPQKGSPALGYRHH
jgi:hypothetical protein